MATAASGFAIRSSTLKISERRNGARRVASDLRPTGW